MTRFGTSIEPITSLTQSGRATCYAKYLGITAAYEPWRSHERLTYLSPIHRIY